MRGQKKPCPYMLCTGPLYATMTLCMACACMVRMLAKLLQKTRAQYSDFHLSWTLKHKRLSLRGTSWAVVLWLKMGSPGIMMPCSNSYCANSWMAVTSLNIASIAYAVELFTAGLKTFLAIQEPIQI